MSCYGEIFYSLTEARIVIERRLQPATSTLALRYRPPAPVKFGATQPLELDTAMQ
jgi:hypothetical protein